MPSLIEIGILLELRDKASKNFAKVSESMASSWKGAALGIASVGAIAGAALLGIGKFGAESAEKIKQLGAASGLSKGQIEQVTERAKGWTEASDKLMSTLGALASNVTKLLTPGIQALNAVLKLLVPDADDAAESLKGVGAAGKKSAEEIETALSSRQQTELELIEWREAKAEEEEAFARVRRENQKIAEAARAVERAKEAAADEARMDRSMARLDRLAELQRQSRELDLDARIAARKTAESIEIEANARRFEGELAAYEQRRALKAQEAAALQAAAAAEEAAARATAQAIGGEFYNTFKGIIAGSQAADEALIALGGTLLDMFARKGLGLLVDALFGLVGGALGFAVGGPAGAAVGAAVGAGAGSGVGSSASGLTAGGSKTVVYAPRTVVPQTRGQIDRAMRDSVGPAFRRLQED